MLASQATIGGEQRILQAVTNQKEKERLFEAEDVQNLRISHSVKIDLYW